MYTKTAYVVTVWDGPGELPDLHTLVLNHRKELAVTAERKKNMNVIKWQLVEGSLLEARILNTFKTTAEKQNQISRVECRKLMEDGGSRIDKQ